MNNKIKIIPAICVAGWITIVGLTVRFSGEPKVLWVLIAVFGPPAVAILVWWILRIVRRVRNWYWGWGMLESQRLAQATQRSLGE